jgi:hypothetical protein
MPVKLPIRQGAVKDDANPDPATSVTATCSIGPNEGLADRYVPENLSWSVERCFDASLHAQMGSRQCGSICNR